MTRPNPSPRENNLSLFTAAAEPTLVSTQFWLQLLRYRPVILLGSLWLGLICVAAVAYSRLMFAGVTPAKLDAELPPRTEIRTPLRGPRGASQAAPAAIPAAVGEPNPTGSDLAGPDLAGPDPSSLPDGQSLADHGGFSSGALGALVGLCALGCFWMHRQATASPRSPSARRLPGPAKLPAQGLPKSISKRSGLVSRSRLARPAKPATPKRLQPYSPERDQVVVTRQVPLGQSPAAKAAPSAPPLPMPPPDPDPPTSDSPPVAIVPESESMPLDWSEESLAHARDIRQHRPLSSFM